MLIDSMFALHPILYAVLFHVIFSDARVVKCSDSGGVALGEWEFGQMMASFPAGQGLCEWHMLYFLPALPGVPMVNFGYYSYYASELSLWAGSLFEVPATSYWLLRWVVETYMNAACTCCDHILLRQEGFGSPEFRTTQSLPLLLRICRIRVIVIQYCVHLELIILITLPYKLIHLLCNFPYYS